MQRIIAQAHKELRQIFRDRTILILSLVLPLTTLAAIGTSVSLKVTELPIIVRDLDQTALSRQYQELFRQSLTFHVEPSPVNVQPERILDNNRARAAIIIPKNFERDFLRGLNVEVQILVDASDANTANIIRA